MKHAPYRLRPALHMIAGLCLGPLIVGCGGDSSQNSPDTTQNSPETTPEITEPPVQCVDANDCSIGLVCTAGECVAPSCDNRNACGGCNELPGAIDDPCGPCNKDRLQCAPGGASLVCDGDTACSDPVVRTNPVTALTPYSATLNAEVPDLGGKPINQHGFCWDVSGTPRPGSTPTVTCSELGPLSTTGPFTEQLSALAYGTAYFVAAYVRSDDATAYGLDASWTTPLPAITTESATAGDDLDSLVVIGTLAEGATPAYTRHGACFSTEVDPMLNDDDSSCISLGERTEAGEFTVPVDGLTLGQLYYIRAFAARDTLETYGNTIEYRFAPATPVLTSVSTDDPVQVSLTWDAVPFATGYEVYRDDVLVTQTPVTNTTFSDTSAASASPPSMMNIAVTASSDLTNAVVLSWEPAVTTSNPAHTYTVRAINAGGSSAPSAPLEGKRGLWPIIGYQVSINGSDFQPVSGTLEERTHTDSSAPAGQLDAVVAQASQGTFANYVELSVTGGEAHPGTSVNYRVRAQSADGPGDPSEAVPGQRAAATRSFKWQTQTGSSWNDLQTTEAPTYQDTGAPANGTARTYRVIVTAGEASQTSANVTGYRGLQLPVFTTVARSSTVSSVTVGGSITSLGNVSSLSAHGYCIGTSPSPEYANGNPNCKNFGSRSTTGNLTDHTFSGLTASNSYYARTYGRFLRNGTETTAYGPEVIIWTKPAKPAAPTIEAESPDWVKISPSGYPSGVTAYKVYRQVANNPPTLVGTGNVIKFGFPLPRIINPLFTDSSGPTPGAPQPPTGFGVTTRYCDGVDFAWNASAPGSRGFDTQYTVVAINPGGESEPSNATTGSRAPAPAKGYRIRNASVPNSDWQTVTGLSARLMNIRARTVTPGTATASKGSWESTIGQGGVTLAVNGASHGALPADEIQVRAFSDYGDGSVTRTTASRADCGLLYRWERASASNGPWTLLAGATSRTSTDTTAPASGEHRFYRAKVFTQGADSFAQYSTTAEGWNFATAPAIQTVSAVQPNPGTAILEGSYKLFERGYPSVTAWGVAICFTSNASISDARFYPSSGIDCLYTTLTAPYEVDTYTFTNTVFPNKLVLGRTYRVRAAAKNPNSEWLQTGSNGWVLGAVKTITLR